MNDMNTITGPLGSTSSFPLVSGTLADLGFRAPAIDQLRGMTETIRGLGTLASPRTFGHGGVGTSYCWADPDSGVSFAYLSNSRIPEPWHSQRLDSVSNLVHSAID